MTASTCFFHRGGYCVWDSGPNGEDVLCYGNKCDAFTPAITSLDYAKLNKEFENVEEGQTGHHEESKM